MHEELSGRETTGNTSFSISANSAPENGSPENRTSISRISRVDIHPGNMHSSYSQAKSTGRRHVAKCHNRYAQLHPRIMPKIRLGRNVN